MLVLAGLSLGAARYQFAQPAFTPDVAAWYNDHPGQVALVGVIVKPPDVRESHVQVEVAAEDVTVDGETMPVSGRVLAYLSIAESWAYGDRVRIWGMLQTPPNRDDFSYQDYLVRQRIYSYMPYTSAEVISQGNASRWLAGLYAFK